ncbi:MAG: carboxypeptidase regulatory-like domain-containing protein [Candidatus Sumerlaeaceae bacterium]
MRALVPSGVTRTLLILTGAVLLLCAFWWLVSVPTDSEDEPQQTTAGRLLRNTRTRIADLWKSAPVRQVSKKSVSPRQQSKQATKPESDAAVQLVIVNDRQLPVKDARIELRNASAAGKAVQLSSGSSGSVGAQVAPGTYEVSVSHPQYARFVTRIIALANSPAAEVRIILAARSTVKGRILDEERQPLSAVQITAERRRLEHLASGATTYVNNAAYAPQETDERGEFLMDDIALGPNRFVFSLEGYAPVQHDIEVPAGGPKEPLEIVLRRPAAITGRIFDEQQTPVSSATLKILAYRYYGEADRITTASVASSSDTTGAFALKQLLAGANYDVQVEHPSYATAVFKRIPAESHDLIWVLERGGEISGRALYIDRPTTAAHVRLGAQAVIQGTTFTTQVMSNADGNWKFEHLPYGHYRISVDYDHLVSEPRPLVTSVKDRATTGVLVEVYEALRIAGKTIDTATDLPVSKATITANATYGYLNIRSRTFTVTADEDGEFSFERLPGGSHSLVGKADGYLSSDAGGANLTVSLQPGERQDQIIVPMSRGGSVEGYVRNAEHEGLAEAEVQLFVASTTLSSFSVKDLHTMTDGGGRFVIRGFPLSERVQLYCSASKPGYAKGRSTLIDLTAHRPNALTNITLSAGGVVMGKIMDTAGKPLNQAKIIFESREFLGDPSPSGFSVQSGSDGVYLLEHCTPGSMRVTASRPEYVTQVRSGTIKEGALLNKFDFKLQAATRIAGVVGDFHGKPIAGAKVSATPLEKATGFASSVTNKKGEFNIGSLSQGFFRVEAGFPLTTPDGVQQYTFIAPRVKSGVLTLPIDCDVEPALRGEIIGNDGKRVDRFKLALRSRTDTNPPQDFRFNMERSLTSAHGQFRVLQVPRGIYTLEIRADGYELYRSESIVVGPGLHTDLPTVRLKSASGIVGTVVSATTGNPVSNCIIRVLDTARPETITVNRLELGAYSRQDVMEWLDAWFDYNADLDPNRIFRPVARVRANVTSTAKTDYSGRFNVGGTAPGQYTLEFEHPSYSSLRLARVAVARAQPTDVGEVQMQPGGEVHGQVVDGQGRPVYSATVIIRDEKTGRDTSRTDLGGNYLLRGIAPGRRTVVIRAIVGGRSIYAYAFVEVREDESTLRNFVLALDATVQGTLVPPDGAAVKSGMIRLYPLDENARVMPELHYDATARGALFTISNIPHGTYIAVVTGSAGGTFAFWEQVEISKGENTVGLPLGASYLGGIAVGPTGTAAPGVKVRLRPDPATNPLPAAVYNLLIRTGTTGTSGKFNIPYLPAGVYEIQYSTALDPVFISAGQLSLSAGQRLSGYRLEIP